MSKFVLSKPELEDMYLGQKLNMRQIAEMHGVSMDAVYRHMKKYGITRRSNSEAHAGLNSGEQSSGWKGGTINKKGYRLIQVAGKQRLQHRVVMEEFIGRPLKREETIHHKNGNKLDNSLDNLELIDNRSHVNLHARQRAEQGISVSSDLTPEQVQSIRNRRSLGEKLHDIAVDFGLSTSTISRIALGKTWKYADGPIIKTAIPLYIWAAHVLDTLGQDNFVIRDKAAVKQIVTTSGRRYRGKLDDECLSNSLTEYVSRGGELWKITHQFVDSHIPNQRERVFHLQRDKLSSQLPTALARALAGEGKYDNAEL